MFKTNGAKMVIVRGSKMRLIDLVSKRELDVLRLLVEGNTNKLMAEKLGISEKTIESHRNNINSKLRQLTGHTYPTEILVHMAVWSGITRTMQFPFLEIDPTPS